MKRKKNLILLFCCLFVAINTIQSQIGINTENPNNNTALDIVANDRGIMIPRLTEKERDNLVINLTGQDLLSINSLLIFNTTENCYNFYDVEGGEWKSLCGTLKKADINIVDCNAVAVGSFREGIELTGANYIKAELEVKRAGSYQISGMSGNGYFFNTSGEYLEPGNYTLYVPAFGTPIAEQTDAIDLIINGNDVGCTVSVTVTSSLADYNVDCGSATINGNYYLNTTVNPNSNTLTVNVNVTEVGTWRANTTKVNGVSFSGSGLFTTTGSHMVTLLGSGKPESAGSFTVDIAFYTKSWQVNCLTATNYTSSVAGKRIGVFGSGDNAPGNSSSFATGLFLNQANFGPSGTYQISNLAVEYIKGGNIKLSDVISATTLTDSKPYDVILMTMDAEFDSNDAAIAMAEYVKKGGVFIWLNEHLNSFANGKSDQNRYFFNYLLGANVSDNNINGDVLAGSNITGYVSRLPNINHPIINGVFADLRNQYLGADNGSCDSFGALPNGSVEWSMPSYDHITNGDFGKSNDIFMFKAANYNFFWWGEGSAFKGSNSNSLKEAPLYVNGSKVSAVPSTKQYGSGSILFYGKKQLTIRNAEFLCNIIAWALDTAETNGINTNN